MDKHHFELLCAICERPVFYVGSSTLPEVCAFIAGIHLATGCLNGFREWLVTKLDDGAPELTWQSLVVNAASEKRISNADAVAHLGSLIEDFYDFLNPTSAESHRGLMRVFLHYHAWRVKRGFGPPFDGTTIDS